LAGDLGLAVNTVARAYRELEGAGVLTTRGRQGSFVARSDPADAAMAAAAESYADTARSLGVDRDRARCYLEAAFDGPSSGSVPNSSSA
jgi:DNA-binding transcriptional regulator YhcF (GntR family)